MGVFTYQMYFIFLNAIQNIAKKTLKTKKNDFC